MQVHAKVPEKQNVAPSQNQELTREGATPQNELSPQGHVSAESPPQPSPSALGLPQQAQDLSPNQKDGDVQQSDLSLKIGTTNLPENEAQTSEVEAGEVGLSTTTSSRGPPHADPPPAPGPQTDQDEESDEARVTSTGPPPSEPPQGPGPVSLSPQRTQDEETESASLPLHHSHHDPPRQPSQPDGAKMLEPSQGDSQQPLEEGAPKTEVVQVHTPFPGVSHPQDPRNTKKNQDGEDPVTLLSRSQLAPTRLPQPRVLAPLQSRRPTPRLPSLSREEASGTASDQTLPPSPRPPLAQEEDPGKLPLISPPHSKPSERLSPHAGHSPQQDQEEKVQDVKLPLLSPPVQEHAAQPAPDPPQEDEAQGVRLPHIPTPFGEQQLPQKTGAPHDSRPAKERRAPKVGRSSGKKIPGMQASPQNQEPVQQMGARKKKLPTQRETAKGPAHLTKVSSGGHQPALQPESQSRSTRPKVSIHPHPSPPRSPQRNQRGKVHPPEIPEPAHSEPLPRDSHVQEEERGRVHYSRKDAHAKLPPDDPVQKVAVSQTGPSLKRENSGGLFQENETTLSCDQPTPEGTVLHRRPLQNQKTSAESSSGIFAPREPPRREEGVPKRGRSQKRQTASDVPEQDDVAPTQPPAKETSQTRESPVQGDNASRQQSKEKRPRKHGAAPQEKSPAAPQNQASAEEQGSWKGKLRARGSQSTKV